MLSKPHMHQTLPTYSFPNHGNLVFSLLPGPCATTDFFSSYNLVLWGFFDHVSVSQ